MDRRHARPTPRVPGADHPTANQSRRSRPYLYGFSTSRPNVLPCWYRRRFRIPVSPLRPRRCQSRHRTTHPLQRPRCSRYVHRLSPCSGPHRSRGSSPDLIPRLDRQTMASQNARDHLLHRLHQSSAIPAAPRVHPRGCRLRRRLVSRQARHIRLG